ncbi:MAG: hypothetical protein ACP5N3_04285 [Candidatus Nanoarchaeia archaeon]
MDVLAHALWGLIVFHSLSLNYWLIALFSILPDLVSFVPWMIHNLVTKGRIYNSKDWKNRTKMIKSIPKYVFRLYDITHSLVISGFIFLVLFFTVKEYSYYMLPWMLHIIIDIPSHPRDFFGTPILFPFSNFKFNGIPWSHKWFMIINYSSIIIVGGILLVR